MFTSQTASQKNANKRNGAKSSAIGCCHSLETRSGTEQEGAGAPHVSPRERARKKGNEDNLLSVCNDTSGRLQF